MLQLTRNHLETFTHIALDMRNCSSSSARVLWPQSSNRASIRVFHLGGVPFPSRQSSSTFKHFLLSIACSPLQGLSLPKNAYIFSMHGPIISIHFMHCMHCNRLRVGLMSITGNKRLLEIQTLLQSACNSTAKQHTKRCCLICTMIMVHVCTCTMELTVEPVAV